MSRGVAGSAAAAPGQVGPLEELVRIVSMKMWAALGVIALGLVLGYVVWRLNRVILRRADIPAAVEGTAFERTARGFGTTTVDIVATLSAVFVTVVSVVVALAIADVTTAAILSTGIAQFLFRMFLGAIMLIAGVLVGDKLELLVSERLRSVKLPEATVVPTTVKYTVFYVAGLLALAQVGIDVIILILLFGVYAFALVLFTAIALKDLLACGAAGMYLLLSEPYGIGDEVQIGETQGIVQEVDVFVTRIESEGREFIVPNRNALEEGIVHVRE
ncbi:MAG: mechanosensitive ion channel domain-containing protein [Halolamina sp.]